MPRMRPCRRTTSRLPPALNIIALATFAASLSARALDPVLPHVADDFGVSIATAAGFCGGVRLHLRHRAAGAGRRRRSVRQGAADDRVPRAARRCQHSRRARRPRSPLLFATRILAGIGSGGVFPVALGLTSDLVGPDKRQVAIGRTLAGAMTGNLLGASLSGLIGDFLGWRGVLAVLGALVDRGVDRGRGRLSRRRADAPAARPICRRCRHGYRTIFTNPNARICYSAVFIEGCCVLGLFPFIASFLFELGETSLSIAGIVIAGFAVGGLFYTMTVSRFLPRLGVKGMMIAGATLVGAATRRGRVRPGLEAPGAQPAADGLGLLHDPRLPAGVRQRAVGGSARHRAVAAFVLLLHGPDHRPDRLWLRHPACRQGADACWPRRP